MEQFVRPTIVVSKCLEFEHCRYDGSMISDLFVRKLKNYVDFIPLCPQNGDWITVSQTGFENHRAG